MIDLKKIEQWIADLEALNLDLSFLTKEDVERKMEALKNEVMDWVYKAMAKNELKSMAEQNVIDMENMKAEMQKELKKAKWDKATKLKEEIKAKEADIAMLKENVKKFDAEFEWLKNYCEYAKVMIDWFTKLTIK